MKLRDNQTMVVSPFPCLGTLHFWVLCQIDWFTASPIESDCRWWAGSWTGRITSLERGQYIAASETRGTLTQSGTWLKRIQMDFTLKLWCDRTVPLRRCDAPVQDILKHFGCGMAVTCHFGQVLLDVLQIGHEKLHIRNMFWTTVLDVHCESIQIRSTDRDTDTDKTYVKSWFYGHNFGPWKPHSEFAVFYHLIPSILFLHFVDPNSPVCLLHPECDHYNHYNTQVKNLQLGCILHVLKKHISDICQGMVYHWPKATLLANLLIYPTSPFGQKPWETFLYVDEANRWISRYVSRVLGLLLEKELNN